jgi:hypothetical protein
VMSEMMQTCDLRRPESSGLSPRRSPDARMALEAPKALIARRSHVAQKSRKTRHQRSRHISPIASEISNPGYEMRDAYGSLSRAEHRVRARTKRDPATRSAARTGRNALAAPRRGAPKTATNLGNVEVKLELYRDAAEHLDYSLRHYPTAENQERRKSIEGLLAKIRPHVGGVKVSVDTPGAQVFIDGKPVGVSPLAYEFFVEAGSHKVRAELKGDTVSTEFVAENGETSAVSLKLEDTAAAASSDKSPPVEETPRAERNWVPAYVLGGVTVAALGTSFVFRGLAGGKKKDIDDLEPSDPSGCVDSSSSDCTDLSDAIDAHKTFADVSNVSLIVGGVAAATTIGYITYALIKKSPPVQTGIAVSGTSGFVTINGSF